MTQFAKPLDQRHGFRMADLFARVRRVEARTAGIDSGFPLMAVPAVVTTTGLTYTDTTGVLAALTGQAAIDVDINGSASATGPFPYLASYTPTVSDVVLLVPVVAARTYIVIGKIV